MAVIYLGPNKQKYGLMRNRVYEDGLPEYVEQAIQEVPEIGKLIVSTKELESSLRLIRKKGTVMHRAYEVVNEVR